ncbi:right-handed parallel beta-helix repeat-containing protein [Camelimonas lactis]|uniref:Pectate lyase-like protein n=1 Tax=Camelimonas lactis TaxID=659006 RepID=A0A4R2H0A7_9HYPH|nr:right-handed parallel beta-helix repeat-containing protein [Camelimonas lactis]TCO15883.1 hypothetical protein EV666_101132 [Camelimonas lactis]
MPDENTVSVTAGSTAVLGHLTQFVGFAGDTFNAGGLSVPVAAVVSTSELTLAYGWPGPDVIDSAAWVLMPTAPDWSSTVALHKAIVEANAWRNGKFPFPFNAGGPIAKRDLFDGEPTGFTFLELTGDQDDPFRLYGKMSDESGDWSVGQTLRGEKGATGDNFQPDETGPFADRGNYDDRDPGFAYLADDQGLLYFRLRPTGWSTGVPFGKGDKGDSGAGVASGGAPGQALVKSATTDYATTWETIDKDFVGLGSVTNKSEAQMVASGAISEALDLKANAADLGTAAARALTEFSYNVGTLVAASSRAVPVAVSMIQTDGYSGSGDGGAAEYRRVTSEPSHSGKLQTADGAWWELASPSVTPEMFGAKGDGVTDDGPAINVAIAYCREMPDIGMRLDLSPRARYGIETPIDIAPFSNKQLIIEGNDAQLIALPGLTGFMVTADNDPSVWGYRIAVRNLTAIGRYNDATVSFLRVNGVNSMLISGVMVQSFNQIVNISNSYNLEINNCVFRYAKQYAIISTTSSMQLHMISSGIYDTLDAASIRLSSANHNVTIRDCDFEVGGSSAIHTEAIDNLTITGCYIEGYDVNPVFFGGACAALLFEGNWLGYNDGAQEWVNIKGGSIRNNVFASQVTVTPVNTNNENVSCSNNAFIYGANRFFFPRSIPTMASGATDVGGAGWFLDDSGVVHLQGAVSRTSDGNVFQLPVGARPGRDCEFAIRVGPTGVSRARVWADGSVSIYPGGTTATVYLDGISFRAYA